MNILKSAKQVVTSRGARQLLVLEKNSPTILFGAGVIGVVATAVLTARATLKISDVLDAHDHSMEMIAYGREKTPETYSEQDAMQDKVVTYTKTTVDLVKLYAPAIAVGTIAIACLTKSHNILSKRNVALTAAYATVDKAFKEYRERVIGELGAEKDREFQYGTVTVQERVTDGKGKTKTVTKTKVNPKGFSQYSVFFDEYNKMWKPEPSLNKIFLLSVQDYANDILHLRGHLLLNDVYAMLGMERTGPGCVVGWISGPEGHDNHVSFGLDDGDSEALRDFVNGYESSVRLDFNVDGVIYELIERNKR